MSTGHFDYADLPPEDDPRWREREVTKEYNDSREKRLLQVKKGLLSCRRQPGRRKMYQLRSASEVTIVKKWCELLELQHEVVTDDTRRYENHDIYITAPCASCVRDVVTGAKSCDDPTLHQVGIETRVRSTTPYTYIRVWS